MSTPSNIVVNINKMHFTGLCLLSVSQENNWIFVSQVVEAYYYNIQFDDDVGAGKLERHLSRGAICCQVPRRTGKVKN
jgi:hypothetical protein